jgi:hypothetical protein
LNDLLRVWLDLHGCYVVAFICDLDIAGLAGYISSSNVSVWPTRPNRRNG